MKLPRRLYVAYEPIIATVSVTNLTGRDVMLDEIDGQKWFSFQIETGEERLVPPRNPNYELAPLMIPSGQTVKRNVDLIPLYPVTDYGLYRVKASVYLPDLHRYFSSALTTFQVSEGKTLWQQTVGVPEGQPGAGEYRTFSLLSFRQPKDNMLYVRVADRDGSVIFMTQPLGRLVDAGQPQVNLDTKNRLHVLQIVGPKTYAYSRIGVNGEWFGQVMYSEVNSRPSLKRLASGEVGVAGGQMDVPRAEAVNGMLATPKLSDRPAGMPSQ